MPEIKDFSKTYKNLALLSIMVGIATLVFVVGIGFFFLAFWLFQMSRKEEEAVLDAEEEALQEHEELVETWERTWICKRCGAGFFPPMTA